MEDTISRKAAIDAVCKAGCGSGFCGIECDEVLALRNMPSAQPEKRTEERTETHGVCLDAIDRQATIDAHYEYCNKHPDAGFPVWSLKILEDLPSAQPEIIRCEDCRWQKDQSGSTAWLPCRAIVTPSDFYCGRAERRTDEAR